MPPMGDRLIASGEMDGDQRLEVLGGRFCFLLIERTKGTKQRCVGHEDNGLCVCGGVFSSYSGLINLHRLDEGARTKV